jgi:hypothetical protein
VLGDVRTIPEPASIAAAFSVPGDPAAADVLTLATSGAGIESLLSEQISQLPGDWFEPVVVAFGAADAEGPAPVPPHQYGEMVDALFSMLGRRGPLAVSAIPETFTAPASTEQRLSEARRLRHILEYNDAIRAAALTYDAVVLEPDVTLRPAATASSGARPSPATAFDASVRFGRTSGSRTAISTGWLSGFDGAARDALRLRAATALAAGQRLDVVAKLGDSITSSPSFLTQVTEAAILNSPYAHLDGTLRYFSRTLVPDGLTAPSTTGGAPLVPSLARRSLGSADRWYVTDVLNGGDASALVREVESIRPGVAVVMFGTNDLTLTSVEAFEEHLNALLRELEQHHVLPILSTIPSRRDQSRYAERVPSFNSAIRAMAAVHQVPLMEYAAAMAGLPNAGLSDDGIHPSVCPAGAGSLNAECLRYGYNMRNLLALLALEKLQQSVLDDRTDRLVSQSGSGQ